MQLSVKGKQLDIGEAFRSHIESGLDRVLGKYFGKAIEAQVTVSKSGRLFHATITAHVGRQINLSAQAEADEAYPAFDAALERLSKRLRRHKRRLRDHHKEGAAERESQTAQQYILSGPDGSESENEEAAEEDFSATEPDTPAVIAEMETEIASLTVSEAVMRMDLAELPALMFRNRAHGGLNMVYRRGDGNIGWIDPRGNSAS